MIDIFISNKNGYLIKKDYSLSNDIEDIIIDDGINYQTCLGFGGAVTNSVYYNYSLMDDRNKKEFINKVYSKDGLNYNFIRVSIGSCDFSTHTYDYLEDGFFSLKHDIDSVFKIINEAKLIRDIDVVAAPWSPPAKYKTNGIRQHGGKLKSECYEDYANYLINYLLEMNKINLNVTYLTLQNEAKAIQVWDSCIFEPEDEARLVETIYPKIIKNKLDTKLLIWDHNKDIIVDRVKNTINDFNDKFISGVAYHWYDNYCNNELSKVHELYNDKIILFTEGCIELLLLDKDNPANNIGNFINGLRYAKNYILDSENYSNGFIDWNILLDELGGPNYVGNYCEAPILYNKVSKELIYNPSYYIISHFSRFIEKGDIRIKTIVNKSNIIATSYKKQDKSIVIVLLNEGDNTDIKLKIKDKCISFNIDSNSIATIIYNEK